MNYSDEQRTAIHDATERDRLSIVTGGAGTGKTSVIAGICEALSANSDKFELCAPTGKAAARIREVTGYDAHTVHRMLGWCGEYFTRKKMNGVTVVMDEASMCDAVLMAEVIKRKPWRVILVGDPTQLPPVGKGAPFHDLIRFRPALVSRLTHCFRASAAIAKAAMAVRDGGKVSGADSSGGEKWNLINTGSPIRTHAQIVQWVENSGWDWEQDVILCCRNGTDEEPGALTVKGLNLSLVEVANPRDDYDKYAPGDRIINLKNCADADVWNGDTGTVSGIDHGGNAWVKMDRGGEEVQWTKEMLRDTQLAYALTVHKSQGSEFRNVIFGCVKRDGHMLSKQLIYTAVTRAKKACCVAGEYGAFFSGINQVDRKTTVLQALLRESE